MSDERGDYPSTREPTYWKGVQGKMADQWIAAGEIRTLCKHFESVQGNTLLYCKKIICKIAGNTLEEFNEIVRKSTKIFLKACKKCKCAE